jgi:hypothetical protein
MWKLWALVCQATHTFDANGRYADVRNRWALCWLVEGWWIARQ